MQPTGQMSAQVADVERRTRSAIFARLGHAEPRAVISLADDPARPGSVLLHVNSGGNALACEEALAGAGYAVDPGAAAPGRHGVLLRATPALTFAQGVRCGGCGETLPDQEGVARDCECIRIEVIPCHCPDANLRSASFVDNCPKHGTDGPANEQAAVDRGPWYGQPTEAARA